MAATFSSSARTVDPSAGIGSPSTGGPHDIGGVPLVDESPSLNLENHVKALWEKQVDAIRGIAQAKGLMNVDQLRRGVEQLEPEVYRDWSYYGKWAASICRILLEKGALTQSDLDAELGPPASDTTVRFAQGQRVRVKPEQTKSRWRKPHLRVPGYIYSARGVVERVAGVFKNPEALAFNLDTDAVQPLYRVRFPMREVWKQYPGSNNDSIDVEIYQHWLEPDDHPSPSTASHDHSHTDHDHSHTDHAHSHNDDGTSHTGHAHDHSSPAHAQHAHSHDGGIPHVHESRAQVEQTAVDREGPEGADEHFAKCFIAACVKKGVTSVQQLAEVVERRDAIEGRGFGPIIVAKAWSDPEFKNLLLKDAAKAVAGVGVALETEMMAVENTESVHNLIVCTLCSCYPRSVLGLPPDWYKSRLYRSRAVTDPRGLLKESFGLEVPGNVELRVHDSTADMRYLVIPARPKGTEGWSEEKLQALVTRDMMVGVAVPKVDA